METDAASCTDSSSSHLCSRGQLVSSLHRPKGREEGTHTVPLSSILKDTINGANTPLANTPFLCVVLLLRGYLAAIKPHTPPFIFISRG